MRQWSATCRVRSFQQCQNATTATTSSCPTHRVARQFHSAGSVSRTVTTQTTRSHAPPHRCYSVLAAQAKPQPSEQTVSPLAHDSKSARPRADPYKLVAPQLQTLRDTLLNLLGSSHPSLTEIAQYYFLHPSKQIRPLLVLLFSQATNGLGRGWPAKKWAAECEGAGGRAQELDTTLTRPDVLNDWNPNMPDHTASFSSTFSLRNPRSSHEPPVPPLWVTDPSTPTLVPVSTLLPTQIRLAQIVEMIHVASLLHDDVIDNSPLRRGAPSAPAAFGNKLSVLAGDFLLGRASAALSRLGESEVVELIAGVIANLVEGEILQLKAVHGEELGLDKQLTQGAGKENWNIYLQKSYMKTASLMAKGARAAVVLSGCREGELWKEIAYAYGRNIGLAFQVCARHLSNVNLNLTDICPCSLSMIFWTTKLARVRWVNLGVLTFN